MAERGLDEIDRRIAALADDDGANFIRAVLYRRALLALGAKPAERVRLLAQDAKATPFARAVAAQALLCAGPGELPTLARSVCQYGF